MKYYILLIILTSILFTPIVLSNDFGTVTTIPIGEPVLTFSMPASLTTYKDETIDFTITVNNPSTYSLHNNRISIIGIPSDSYYTNPSIIDSLGPSEMNDFMVFINTLNIKPGDYTLKVNITTDETYEDVDLKLKVEKIEKEFIEEEKEDIETKVNIIKILSVFTAVIAILLAITYYINSKHLQVQETSNEFINS